MHWQGLYEGLPHEKAFGLPAIGHMGGGCSVATKCTGWAHLKIFLAAVLEWALCVHDGAPH